MDLFSCETRDDVNFCLKRGDNIESILDGETPLISHCRRCNIEVVCELIEQGANTDFETHYYVHYLNTPLLIACYNSHTELVEQMLRYDSVKNSINKFSGWFTPLTYACSQGKCDIFDILVDAGADINLPDGLGDTPLMDACNYNKIDIVDKLLALGVNVNHRNDDGLTAAFVISTPEILNRLYIHGLDLSIVDNNGNTPLTSNLADAGFNAEVIELMIDYYNNVNVGGYNGYTPLIHAVFHNNEDLVKFLLHYGADVNICDDEGKTALDHARDIFPSVCDLLQSKV